MYVASDTNSPAPVSPRFPLGALGRCPAGRMLAGQSCPGSASVLRRLGRRGCAWPRCWERAAQRGEPAALGAAAGQAVGTGRAQCSRTICWESRDRKDLLPPPFLGLGLGQRSRKSCVGPPATTRTESLPQALWGLVGAPQQNTGCLCLSLQDRTLVQSQQMQMPTATETLLSEGHFR